MTLAIFDLDHTLLSDDSDNMWGDFIVEQGLVDEESYAKQNEQFYQDYKTGRLDAIAYLNFVAKPLSQIEPEILSKLHHQFMREKVEPVILAKGLALLDEHRQKGDLLMIITATNRFITGPIAERLGVDVLIAADLEVKEGRYTGKPSGVPTFKEGKVIRLQQWLKDNEQQLEGAYFYSDSHNDIPLLKLVEHPTAVDPDDKLREFAKQQKMPVITLRD